jgi:hypothetical protein
VVFDETGRTVLPLTEIGTARFRSLLTRGLGQITYSGQRTDIAGGVERAVYELSREARPRRRAAVILVTDGIVDVGTTAQNLDRAAWLRQDLAERAARDRIQVFGIALTEEADYQLIQSVAEATGGEYYRVLTSDAMPSVFDDIRRLVAEPRERALAQVPGEPIVVEETAWGRILVFGVLGLLALGVVAIFVLRGLTRKSKAERMPAAHLVDLDTASGRPQHRLLDPTTRIGRVAGANDIVIPKDTVSARHAQLQYRNGNFYLQDLQSRNHTFLNSVQISDQQDAREVRVRHGDVLAFDVYRFRFEIEAARRAPGTELGGEGTVVRVSDRAPEPQERPSEPSPPEEAPRPVLPVVPQPGGPEEPMQVRPLPPDEPKPAPPTPGAESPPVPLRAPGQAMDEGPPGAIPDAQNCPIHRLSRATARCPKCGRSWCALCMRECHGELICVECAAAQPASDGS